MKAILVVSGKGGVGKSIVSSNLALRLAEIARTGILDADFSASNIGFFLDLKGKQVDTTGEMFTPVEYEFNTLEETNNAEFKVSKTLQVFSIPLVFGEKAITFDGSQKSQFLRDALTQTRWDCEYLVIDMPAGYGDQIKTAAYLLQDVLLGSVIVIQPAHELDGERALQLHKDLEMPILGLIENMSWFQAGAAKYKIFGESVVDALGEKYNVPVFGKIPLSMHIREKVESMDPRLPEEYEEPILNAVAAIKEARPVKPGFLSRVKEWLRGQVEDVLFQFAISANSSIDIPDAMQKYGYPGGTIIRLNIMDKSLNEIITQADWIISGGKFTIADGDNYTVDTQIDITPEALKHIFLQNKFNADGSLYGFDDALRLGHMRIWGNRAMVRGAYFMKRVFNELSMNDTAMGNLGPVLELL